MFEKYADNPVIPAAHGTFYSFYSANPDILEFKGKLFYYFRGQSEAHHDQIGVAVEEKDGFDGIRFRNILPDPVIPVSADPDAPDSLHILDPGSAVLNGKVFLYYSAYSEKGGFGICLATSEDGVRFERSPLNPIVTGALAPEPVIKDGRIYLFYQRWQEKNGKHAQTYFCPSGDGYTFDFSEETEVFSPPEDCVSISTNRIYREGEWYYDLFGKCRKFKDYPESIGIARSRDLIRWEYSEKDVITRGAPGTWDEGALWFATVYRQNGRYYLWYEGGGTGNGRNTPGDIVASDLAIHSDYGGYGVTSFSQIGLAVYDGSLEEFFS